MARLSYCGELVRSHDHDRFLTALFAPRDRREDLLTLYAFNLEIAQIREKVNEPMLGQIRLQWWRETIQGLEAGTQRQHHVVAALENAVVTRHLAKERLLRLISAREFDLEDRAPETLSELKRYAEETSATLTLLALEILGNDRGTAHLAGRHVGLAWALTGLLRAVPFHARMRRLYLPRDLMERRRVSPEDVFGGRSSTPLREIVAEIADVAREHLSHARSQRGVPREALAALLPATLADIYLRRLANVKHDPFRMREARAVRPFRLWVNARLNRF